MTVQLMAAPADLAPNNDLSWLSMPANGQVVLTLAPKEALFCQGDEADFVYQVLEGVLTTYTLLPDGRRQVAGFYYPGDIVGLEHGQEYRSNCDAVRSARVRSMPRKMVFAIAQEQPDLAAKLLLHTTTQLAGMHDHFVLLGRKSAMEKVASFLLTVASRNGLENADEVTFQLPMTRADIADYLGLTIETVSRCMTRLKIAGIIELPRASTVKIPDVLKLAEFADTDADT